MNDYVKILYKQFGVSVVQAIPQSRHHHPQSTDSLSKEFPRLKTHQTSKKRPGCELSRWDIYWQGWLFLYVFFPLPQYFLFEARLYLTRVLCVDLSRPIRKFTILYFQFFSITFEQSHIFWQWAVVVRSSTKWTCHSWVDFLFSFEIFVFSNRFQIIAFIETTQTSYIRPIFSAIQFRGRII